MKPEAGAATRAASPPSIRRRISVAMAAWSAACGMAVGGAVWLAASYTVDALLDDVLRASAGLMAELVAVRPRSIQGQASTVGEPVLNPDIDRFAWQVVANEQVVQRSDNAPKEALRMGLDAGFSNSAQWRVYSLPMPDGGKVLHVGQYRADRDKARGEVTLSAAVSALVVALLGYFWLTRRLRQELQPLQTLSDRVAAWSLKTDQAGQALGEPEREELRSVHTALATLAERLAQRIAAEQAFNAHAAHALRTPLAGIDAQLAVALLDCPPQLADRLQRLRGATARLQAVVAALLAMFRSGTEMQCGRVNLCELVQRLPMPGLQVHVSPELEVWADADLLAAALLNLLDNSQRHGAKQVWLHAKPEGHLLVSDDGPGIAQTQRLRLQQALDEQAYEGSTGLGLMLADRVARMHNGRLRLLAQPAGFAVLIELGPAQLHQ